MPMNVTPANARADAQPAQAEPVTKSSLTFSSKTGAGLAFILGAAAIAFGVVGFVASCALLPAAPAAAVPSGLLCGAVFVIGLSLFKQASLALKNAEDNKTTENPLPNAPLKQALTPKMLGVTA